MECPQIKSGRNSQPQIQKMIYVFRIKKMELIGGKAGILPIQKAVKG